MKPIGLYAGMLLMLGVVLPSVQVAAAILEKRDEPQEGAYLRTLAPPNQRFAVERGLKKNLQFWIDIYGKYTTSQGLIHDAKYIDHVYEVVDFGDRGYSGSTLRKIRKKWREVLLSVHRKQGDPSSFTPEEKRIYELYADINEPNKFLNAAHRKRLRFQLGQKDRFLSGLKQSGRYLPQMEEIFAKEGLPIELTRLPFVESSFNVRARSKVGASGIWQFMRSTGRLFLKINDAVDERNDPIRAAEAAARLLKLNYSSLQAWPLAVTAYNHGRKGMMRAVRKVGSDDLEDVVSGYRSRHFGFASSNFFTELLAAIEVERNSEKYFGPVTRDEPLAAVEVIMDHYMRMKDLCRFLKLDSAQIRELNPALTDLVYSGKRLIPAGYHLRIPLQSGASKELTAKLFQTGYSEIPAVFKLKSQHARRK